MWFPPSCLCRSSFNFLKCLFCHVNKLTQYSIESEYVLPVHTTAHANDWHTPDRLASSCFQIYRPSGATQARTPTRTNARKIHQSGNWRSALFRFKYACMWETYRVMTWKFDWKKSHILAGGEGFWRYPKGYCFKQKSIKYSDLVGCRLKCPNIFLSLGAYTMYSLLKPLNSTFTTFLWCLINQMACDILLSWRF